MAVLIRCNASNINKKVVGWIVRSASLFFSSRLFTNIPPDLHFSFDAFTYN